MFVDTKDMHHGFEHERSHERSCHLWLLVWLVTTALIILATTCPSHSRNHYHYHYSLL